MIVFLLPRRENASCSSCRASAGEATAASCARRRGTRLPLMVLPHPSGPAARGRYKLQALYVDLASPSSERHPARPRDRGSSRWCAPSSNAVRQANAATALLGLTRSRRRSRSTPFSGPSSTKPGSVDNDTLDGIRAIAGRLGFAQIAPRSGLRPTGCTVLRIGVTMSCCCRSPLALPSLNIAAFSAPQAPAIAAAPGAGHRRRERLPPINMFPARRSRLLTSRPMSSRPPTISNPPR